MTVLVFRIKSELFYIKFLVRWKYSRFDEKSNPLNMISSINDAILRRFLLSRVQIKQYRLKTIFTVCRLKIKKIFEIKIFFLSLIKKATNQDTKATTSQKICYNLCCNLTMFHQMSFLTKNIKPEKTTPASRYSNHTTDANQRYNHTTTRWQTLWYMSLHLPLHWKKATHQYSEDHYFDVHKAHFQQTKIS